MARFCRERFAAGFVIPLSVGKEFNEEKPNNTEKDFRSSIVYFL
jgi:hypothetical protein